MKNKGWGAPFDAPLKAFQRGFMAFTRMGRAIQRDLVMFAMLSSWRHPVVHRGAAQAAEPRASVGSLVHILDHDVGDGRGSWTSHTFQERAGRSSEWVGEKELPPR